MWVNDTCPECGPVWAEVLNPMEEDEEIICPQCGKSLSGESESE